MKLYRTEANDLENLEWESTYQNPNLHQISMALAMMNKLYLGGDGNHRGTHLYGRRFFFLDLECIRRVQKLAYV